MISQKQLSSHIKTQTHPDQTKNQNILDLSRKQLRKIPEIDLQNLSISKIDLSYNFLKSLGSISIVNHEASQNSSRKCKLEWLDISFNILEDIDLKKQQNSPVFKQLQYLNACVNKIQAVSINERIYKHLKQLHLKSNRIKFFLNCPPTLEVLTLDKNILSQLAFTGGNNLQILSAGNNKIQKLAIKTPNLKFLDLQNNQMLNMQMLYEFLENAKAILSINMLQNPLDMNKDYKIIVLSTCPKIVQIDEIFINPHVREGFRILKEEQKLEQVLERTTQNYKKKLEAQLQYKQLMLQQLKLQEKQIESKFHSYCQVQKEQMQVLQQHAKNTLGQRKFRVADQKDQFVQKINSIKNNSVQSSNGKSSIMGQNNEKKAINLDMQQNNHRRDYQNFQRQNAEKFKRQQLPKHQAINFDQEQSVNSILKENNSSVAEKQRLFEKEAKQLKANEKKRKPTLDYRNSRESVIKKGQIDAMNLEGRQMTVKQIPQQIGSYKNLTEKSLSVPKQSEREILNIELGDVIDFNCLKYLSKYYSFYQ